MTMTFKLVIDPELQILHIVSLRETFEWSFMQNFQSVEEIWTENAIQG